MSEKDKQKKKDYVKEYENTEIKSMNYKVFLVLKFILTVIMMMMMMMMMIMMILKRLELLNADKLEVTGQKISIVSHGALWGTKSSIKRIYFLPGNMKDGRRIPKARVKLVNKSFILANSNRCR